MNLDDLAQALEPIESCLKQMAGALDRMAPPDDDLRRRLTEQVRYWAMRSSEGRPSDSKTMLEVLEEMLT